MIDHTCLKTEATRADIKQLCEEAKRYNFGCVFVNPSYVELVRELLENTKVKVGTVVGFPLGANTSTVKRLEASDAVDCGAQEIDMVLNVGTLKSGDLSFVEQDIFSVVDVVRKKQLEQKTEEIVVKVIIETCYLTDEEKIVACQLIEKAGANFVKTSTGLGSAGATVEDVKLLRAHLSPRMGVKASGGIRTLDQTLRMLEAGANRIGTSSGVQMIEELINKK